MGFDDVARSMRERHGQSAGGDSPASHSIDADRMVAEHLQAERRSQGTNQIVFGAVLLIIGVLITAATYGSASQSGGTYIVAYGPMIVGVIKIVRGLGMLGG